MAPTAPTPTDFELERMHRHLERMHETADRCRGLLDTLGVRFENEAKRHHGMLDTLGVRFENEAKRRHGLLDTLGVRFENEAKRRHGFLDTLGVRFENEAKRSSEVLGFENEAKRHRGVLDTLGGRFENEAKRSSEVLGFENEAKRHRKMLSLSLSDAEMMPLPVLPREKPEPLKSAHGGCQQYSVRWSPPSLTISLQFYGRVWTLREQDLVRAKLANEGRSPTGCECNPCALVVCKTEKSLEPAGRLLTIIFTCDDCGRVGERVRWDELLDAERGLTPIDGGLSSDDDDS